MELSRRQLLASGGAAGLLAVLNACSSGSSAPSSAAGSASAGITIWNNLANQDQLTYFQTHFVDAYAGTAKVTFSNKPNNTIDRLIQTSLAAGSGPSIIVTPGPSTGVTEYTKAGYLVDLDEYDAKYGWSTKFAKWALDASKIDGKLRTLPTQYESMAFYFNPATLAKANLTVPKTQDEFEAFCTEAKAKGLTPIAAGNADWKGANEWHLGVALDHAAGPDAVYSALTGKTPFTDPVFVDAITRLTGYFQKGWYGGGVDKYFTNNFPTVYRQLAQGTAAAMISGTWEFANMGPYFGKAAGNTATWDWATVPSLGKGVPEVVWDLAIGQSAGVNSHAANVAGSVDYLNFLTTDKKAIIASIEQMNFEPSPIALSTSDFSKSADPRTVRLYSQLSSAKTIGYTTWTFYPQQTETYMIKYFENVLTNKMTPKDFCAGIQAQFKTELAAGKVPTAPKPGTGLS